MQGYERTTCDESQCGHHGDATIPLSYSIASTQADGAFTYRTTSKGSMSLGTIKETCRSQAGSVTIS